MCVKFDNWQYSTLRIYVVLVMIEQNLSFHRLLIDCQKMYLTALHRLSVHDPLMCSRYFDLDEGICLSFAKISKDEFAKISQSLNHWILSSKSYKSKKSLSLGSQFDDWVSIVCGEMDIDSNSTNDFLYQNEISNDCKVIVNDILDSQATLLLSLGDSAYHSQGFTIAITGLDNQLLDKLVKSWFSSNKMKSLKSLPPIFTINKKIDPVLFLKSGRESLLAVESGLYSFN